MEKLTKGIGQDVWKQDVKPQNLILNISEEGIPANIVNSYPNGARISAVNHEGKIKRFTVKDYELYNEDEVIEGDIAQMQQDIIDLQADVADLSPSIIEFETASLTTPAGETEDVVISNGSLTASSKIFCSPVVGGTNSQGFASVVKVVPALGSATLSILNIGAQASSNDFNGTLKFLLHLFIMLLFVSVSYGQQNRSTIGHTILRDSTISTGQRVFDIRTDTIGIFRNKTLFNSQTYYQRGILFDKVSGVMDSDTLWSGSNALWINSGDNNARIKYDSVGNLYGWQGGTNWWIIYKNGSAFFASGVTQNGALLFQNYLYGTTLTASTNTPDSLPYAPSSTIGDMRFKKNGTYNETVYIKESSSGGTLWSAIKTNSADTMPANTGTISLPMTRSVYTLTPRGDCTINATNGQAGNIIVLIITTTGTTSYTLTFNTNFKTTGTLVTGTVSGKVFTITFTCSSNHTSWFEVARTTAM